MKVDTKRVTSTMAEARATCEVDANELTAGIMVLLAPSSLVPNRASSASARLLVAMMEATMRAQGVAIRYVDPESLRCQDALGRSRLGEVELRRDLLPAAAFEVLVHEFAHEMFHHRDGSVPDEALREFEAQAVSNEVTRGVGIRPLASELTHEQSALLAHLPADDRIHRLAKNILTQLHEEMQELDAWVEEQDEEQERSL